MYKIGIIGDRESVLGFMALGFSVFEAANADEARKILDTLGKSEEYAVIFIVENLAQEMQEDIARYKDEPLPAIVPVPGSRGSTGYGTAIIKKAVERAVGADIIFNK